MNPAFGILVFGACFIIWIIFTFVVYPLFVEPLIKLLKDKYKSAKYEIDSTIDEMIKEESEK